MNLRQCVVCRGELPPPAAVGRPRRYCSAACRQIAAAERKRLMRHLEAAERELREWRHELAVEGLLYVASGRQRCQREVAFWRSEIGRLEIRLAELLGD